MMKFNLSDFVQLDTKGLLTVNGGYNCNGSSNTTVYSNPYYSGNSGGGGNDGNGGGSSGLVSESNWSINGTAVEHSVYVPLN